MLFESKPFSNFLLSNKKEKCLFLLVKTPTYDLMTTHALMPDLVEILNTLIM